MGKAKATAKSRNPRKKKSPSGPVELELRVNAPGMDSLLRAGIGGLACVLEELEFEDPRRVERPGDPWEDNDPPWKVTPEKIVLKFGKPENAHEYLKRLFEYAFQINAGEDAIDLPATYDKTQTALVRARLQRGLMLTFLQHGQSRKGAKTDEDRSVSLNNKQFTYSIRPLTSYKHQLGYKDLVKKKDGCLETKSLDIPGTLYPGAAVRHNKFGNTKYEGTAAELLAAYFALIGTISLPVNRGSAVLLIPEVTNLESFRENRKFATPDSYSQCLIGGIGDAVLGTYARMRGEDQRDRLGVDSISAYLFRPTPWATQQKSRVAAMRVEPLSQEALRIFSFAKSYFPPSLRSHMVKVGKGKKAKEVEQSFWSVSIVKPLIADNLANGRFWFNGFSQFFTRNDPATGKPLRARLFFEKEGLSKMVKASVWEDEGQKALVEGIHYALYCQFGRIGSEFGSNKAGMRNKFQKEFEKWRIQFVNAKTADQFRFSVCDLMSRARGNKQIQDNWQAVLPLLAGSEWQHGRDLALLALASYKGKGDKEVSEEAEPEPVSE